MQQQAISPVLLTIDETGQALRMSRASVYREIKSGRLRSLKIGGKRRVSTQAIHSYVEQLEEASSWEEDGAQTMRAALASEKMGALKLRLPSLMATANPSMGPRGKKLPRN